MTPRVPLLLALLIITIALFASRISTQLVKLLGVASVHQASTPAMPTVSQAASPASHLFNTTKPKTPVFFVSHGGPTFMYPDDNFGGPGAYHAVSKIGKYIKTEIKPEFIIAVSAHWEGQDAIEISVPGGETGVFGKVDELENELFYDFYGFPDHMYREQFHTRGSVELAEDIKESLQSQNIKAKLSSRGLDHGVWVPFKVAFSTNKDKDEFWDIDVPLVQVSLKKTDDFKIHRELGRVLAKYRELGGVVICSGMSVHNLRDMRTSMAMGKTMPYVTPFNELLTSVIVHTGDERFEKLENLKMEHSTILRKAHPTLEHFMPIVVAVGAADDEPANELYNSATLSLGWGLYQFGRYGTSELKI